MWKDWQWVIFFTPFVLGNFSSGFCNLKTAGKKLKQTPKPWVSGVVWSILFLLLGAAWNFALDPNEEEVLVWVFHIMLLLSLLVWPWLYCKSKNLALYLILFSIVSTIVL